mgnify:CR=1 FL=1
MNQEELKEFIECCQSDLRIVKTDEARRILRNIISDLQDRTRRLS